MGLVGDRELKYGMGGFCKSISRYYIEFINVLMYDIECFDPEMIDFPIYH